MRFAQHRAAHRHESRIGAISQALATQLNGTLAPGGCFGQGLIHRRALALVGFFLFGGAEHLAGCRLNHLSVSEICSWRVWNGVLCSDQLPGPWNALARYV